MDKPNINEITSYKDLVVGEHYHLFNKDDGRHSIGRCCLYGEGDDDLKYIKLPNSNSMYWAADHSDEALDIWKIFSIEIPVIDTIYLCPKHHGIGFKSDCKQCRTYY